LTLGLLVIKILMQRNSSLKSDPGISRSKVAATRPYWKGCALRKVTQQLEGAVVFGVFTGTSGFLTGFQLSNLQL
jgi:hypothetical protein